jgi:hypothetical protein
MNLLLLVPVLLELPQRLSFKLLSITQRPTRYSMYGIFESLNSIMHRPKLISQIESLVLWNINHAKKIKHYAES